MSDRLNEIVTMSCDNPLCDKMIETTRRHKIKLNTEDPQKGRLEFVYCGKECQQAHLRAIIGKE